MGLSNLFRDRGYPHRRRVQSRLIYEALRLSHLVEHFIYVFPSPSTSHALYVLICVLSRVGPSSSFVQSLAAALTLLDPIVDVLVTVDDCRLLEQIETLTAPAHRPGSTGGSPSASALRGY